MTPLTPEEIEAALSATPKLEITVVVGPSGEVCKKKLIPSGPFVYESEVTEEENTWLAVQLDCRRREWRIEKHADGYKCIDRFGFWRGRGETEREAYNMAITVG